jgi:hypothetical protein
MFKALAILLAIVLEHAEAINSAPRMMTVDPLGATKGTERDSFFPLSVVSC